MAQAFADRVLQLTKTTGTGAYVLEGVPAGGWTTVASIPGIATGDTVDAYVNEGEKWEVGTYTLQANGTLARTRIHASSNGGASVDWGGGTRQFGVTWSAEQAAAAFQAGSDVVVDTRKLAKWHATPYDGKTVLWSGDSTTEQMWSNLLILGTGTADTPGRFFPELSKIKNYNLGKNGATFGGFIAPGTGGGLNLAGLSTGVDDANLYNADAIVLNWGKNDLRGGSAPGGAGNPLGGNFPDYRVAYGQPGNVAMALVIQYWMQQAVIKLRAANPDICIIWRMPNTAGTSNAYMINGVTAKQMDDVARLAYRGDPALGVPNPEDFAEGILVFDSAGTVFRDETYTANTPLLDDNFHPSEGAYVNEIWLISLLLSGPQSPTLSSTGAARTAAARELSIARGRNGAKSTEILEYSGEWDRAYIDVRVQNTAGNFVDVLFSGGADGNNHAYGGLNNTERGSSGEVGLALGDVIAWTYANGSLRSDTVTRLPESKPGALRWLGPDMSGNTLPTPIPQTARGIVYRHKYLNSTFARYNDYNLTRGKTLANKQQAYQKLLPFFIETAAVGSMRIRGINGYPPSVGETIETHSFSTADVIALPGVEGSSNTPNAVDGYFGLKLTGATFSKSNGAVTIVMAGVDFRNYNNPIGGLLTNTVADRVSAQPLWATVTTNTRTLTALDVNRGLAMNTPDGTPNKVIVPTFATLPVSPGFAVYLQQTGKGITSVEAASSTVKIRAYGQLTLRGRWARAMLVNMGLNEWHLVGTLLDPLDPGLLPTTKTLMSFLFNGEVGSTATPNENDDGPTAQATNGAMITDVDKKFGTGGLSLRADGATWSTDVPINIPADTPFDLEFFCYLDGFTGALLQIGNLAEAGGLILTRYVTELTLSRLTGAGARTEIAMTTNSEINNETLTYINISRNAAGQIRLARTSDASASVLLTGTDAGAITGMVRLGSEINGATYGNQAKGVFDSLFLRVADDTVITYPRAVPTAERTVVYDAS